MHPSKKYPNSPQLLPRILISTTPLKKPSIAIKKLSDPKMRKKRMERTEKCIKHIKMRVSKYKS